MDLGRRRGLVVPLWSVLLAVLLLGPALAPGYVLTYDMVWVPDLALRSDALGTGSGLPRAVPSDAVVAVLDEVVPGMVLQKLVLLGSLVVGGLGAARLAPRGSLLGALAAVTLWQWNPLVVERLGLGHWPVLLGYAALPWLVGAARRWREEGRMPGVLALLVVVGSLSASAGLATAAVLLVLATRREPVQVARVAAVALLANAPWLVAGLLHAGAALGDPAGAAVFALADEGALPGPLAALGLGGAWNAEVLPASRAGAAAWVSTGVLVLLAAVGWRGWWRRVGTREAGGLLVLWLLGWGTAVATWLAPGALGWLAATVPGVGVVRDGARVLVLCAPLLVPVVAQGVVEVRAWVVRAWPGRLPLAPGLVVGALLTTWPVTLMPDVAGDLRAVSYPSSYEQARAAVAAAGPGDVLVLPLSPFRAPAWNGGRTVLDPLGRYLGRDHVAGDELVVSGVAVAGEDPRARRAAQALSAADTASRSEALAASGIGVVVRDRTAPGGRDDASVELAGRELLRTQDLVVTEVAGAGGRRAPASWVVAMVVAWAAWLALLAAAAGRAWQRVRTSRYR
ncbi:hypothetical protein JOE61_003947 [Nocardioides salarius]|uniref:Transmembrane protein n=1 Tax=Nocardioides salarius TaxID=374513 RepID=A0ABS2MG09_9ACTN|nr:hypothetical protein [Nocardioides salarius]MBM7510133.1 hypothetical protein [Nocardioides salarius]